MKAIRKVTVVWITAVMLLAGLLFPVDTAQAKKSGPGYTSPPLCCTEQQCKKGPGWNDPAPRGNRRSGPALQPGLTR